MNKHVIDRDLKPAPKADALAIFTLGNKYAFRGCQGDEHLRLLFCSHLVHFAEMDAYPRRAQFIAAFSTGGSTDARRLEAMYLAEAGILSAREIADCVDWAEDGDSYWSVRGLKPEVV